MRVNKGVLTAGILVLAGYCGGFALSNGSGQVLGMKPVPKSSHKRGGGGGNAEEVAAAAIFNAAAPDGGGGEGGGKHPTLNQNGEGGGGGGGEGAGQALAGIGAGGGAEGSAPGGATPAVPIGGTAAAAFLSGNTVDASTSKDAPRLIYYAPRGLRAEGQPDRFVVGRWDPKAAQTCEPGSDGVRVCRSLDVRREAGEHGPGGRIGTMLVAGERWVPIYKGDRIGVPDRIPLVDTSIAESEPAAAIRKATGKGQAAVDLLVGHVVAAPSEPDADRPGTISSFRADGRVLSVARPAADTDLTNGVAVTVGRWTFIQGVFCQGVSASDTAPACYKPEAWGKAQVRLVPVRKGATQRWNVVAEAPRSALDVAN